MSSSHTISPGVYRLTTGPKAAGQRLDQFLADEIEHCSRGMARRLIDVGGAHLDGRRVRKCSLPVRPGQSVELYVDGLPLKPFELEPKHVLHQDKHLLVINKPAGVATQPTPARYRGTLYDALLRYLQDGFNRHKQPSIGMVQRLDRDTSGVVAFSIHQAAHKALSTAFRERQVDKTYLALVDGVMSEQQGVYRSQLARRRSTNRTVSVERGGKPAETRYRLVQSLGEASLVEIDLVTGRSHQIRAHFSEAGHPLLGDPFYGGPESVGGRPVARQMLHAQCLSLQHPVSGEAMQFEAPLPDDFSQLLEHLLTTPRPDALPSGDTLSTAEDEHV